MTTPNWSYQLLAEDDSVPATYLTQLRRQLHRNCQPPLAIIATIDDNHSDNLTALYTSNPDWAQRINERVALYARAHLERQGFDTNNITIRPTYVTENNTTIK